MQFVEPNSWQQSGGMGIICEFAPGDCLLVKQTPEVHQKVAAFLKELTERLRQIVR
jgi:hypothetical protein